MNKLYKKNEVLFACICIMIYVIGTSVGEAVSQILGVFKLPPMIFHLGFTVLLLAWLKKNDLFEKYGLIRPKYKLSEAWFFIPIMLIAFFSVFFGVILKYSVPETVFYIVSMLCVGFVLVTIFYKGKSLIPCIIFHGINNALSAVSDEQAALKFFGSVEKELYISVGISIIICIVYSIKLWRDFEMYE